MSHPESAQGHTTFCVVEQNAQWHCPKRTEEAMFGDGEDRSPAAAVSELLNDEVKRACARR